MLNYTNTSTFDNAMEIYFNEKISGLQKTREKFHYFLDAMSKRIAQGHARYGSPHKDALYLDRLRLETSAYRRTGNVEHLYNIANYAFLESVAPQHPKPVKDVSVGSVTRGQI